MPSQEAKITPKFCRAESVDVSLPICAVRAGAMVGGVVGRALEHGGQVDGCEQSSTPLEHQPGDKNNQVTCPFLLATHVISCAASLVLAVTDRHAGF